MSSDTPDVDNIDSKLSISVARYQRIRRAWLELSARVERLVRIHRDNYRRFRRSFHRYKYIPFFADA